jgi:triacylglycerol esterase/lipase EstA (alpha/beta hydrolase family)
MRTTIATVLVVLATASAAAAASPPPPGANLPCQPSAAHPEPVILVHGTFENMFDNWQAMAPALKAAGYCVYAFNYGSYNGSGLLGIYGVGRIEPSAQQLASEVDTVLAQTGASKVDLVGHSQGGMMPRYYLKFLGGAEEVHTLVGLSPSNHGTTLDGLFILANFFPGANQFTGALCPACEQQRVDSAFITNLNSGGETVAGVDYTVIQTLYDQVVTPYSSAFLSGSNVRNILLQKQCILDLGDHLSMPYDHIAAADVLTALDPLHPRGFLCTPIAPTAGG